VVTAGGSETMRWDHSRDHMAPRPARDRRHPWARTTSAGGGWFLQQDGQAGAAESEVGLGSLAALTFLSQEAGYGS
jgi:hypothetical protein